MSDKKRDFIPVDKDPIHMIFHSDKWEEVPDEDLWQDGEIKRYDMPKELFEKIIIRGEWKIIRRKDG